MNLPQKTYDIIYADPPWDYHNWNKTWHQHHKESRWVGKKYSLLSTEQICSLPVADISNKNAILFLWTISTKIPDAFKVMEAWGFSYRTMAFVWVKKNTKTDSLFTGLGFYTRSNAEICLLGVKGKVLPRVSRKVHSVILTSRRKHSQKPDEARDRIVQLFGDRSRIELFARQRFDGWDAWGNEIEGEIEIGSL